MECRTVWGRKNWIHININIYIYILTSLSYIHVWFQKAHDIDYSFSSLNLRTSCIDLIWWIEWVYRIYWLLGVSRFRGSWFIGLFIGVYRGLSGFIGLSGYRFIGLIGLSGLIGFSVIYCSFFGFMNSQLNSKFHQNRYKYVILAFPFTFLVYGHAARTLDLWSMQTCEKWFGIWLRSSLRSFDWLKLPIGNSAGCWPSIQKQG